MRKKLSLDDYIEGIQSKDRTILSRAITLVESSHPDHQEMAKKLIHHLLPFSGGARRIGISGTPGVGKSSFLETFGKRLTSQKKEIAVLAVDPTSQKSGGSILGDKTRMTELAIDPLAFIRPSPAGDSLGGVSKRTRETLILCEAFGFDYVFIETVGVGQSETTVSQMVDLFIMLLQPGSGDDLQGIKRGILEIVDMVIVTKDDGDQQKIIQKAKHDYKLALDILKHENVPPVMSCSSLHQKGFEEIQSFIDEYFTNEKSVVLEKRKKQNLDWMWQLIKENLLHDFRFSLEDEFLKKIESQVIQGTQTPYQASAELLDSQRFHLKKSK